MSRKQRVYTQNQRTTQQQNDEPNDYLLPSPHLMHSPINKRTKKAIKINLKSESLNKAPVQTSENIRQNSTKTVCDKASITQQMKINQMLMAQYLKDKKSIMMDRLKKVKRKLSELKKKQRKDDKVKFPSLQKQTYSRSRQTSLLSSQLDHFGQSSIPKNLDNLRINKKIPQRTQREDRLLNHKCLECTKAKNNMGWMSVELNSIHEI